jgi:hypothetical protein
MFGIAMSASMLRLSHGYLNDALRTDRDNASLVEMGHLPR